MQNTVQPICKIRGISFLDFDEIYQGEGDNHGEDPLNQIYPESDELAIFALTIGENLCSMIDDYIGGKDIAIGYVLDIGASLLTINMVSKTESYFLDHLSKDNNDELRVLSYSPGYCGWNLKCQRKLFANLKPEKIGISINESCLMSPMKSCSGVLAAGAKDIHLFVDGIFSFCRDCKSHSCVDRMAER